MAWIDPEIRSGPLFSLTPVFLDIESYVDTEITLKKMTLRQYLSRSYVTALAMAIGPETPLVFEADDEMFDGAVDALCELAEEDDKLFVCHNAAFDIRGMRFKFDMPQPKNVWCTMEGAMCAWPELPGGYGLKNCGSILDFPVKKRKFEFNLQELTKARALCEKSGGSMPLQALPEEIREQLILILKEDKIKLEMTITTALIDLALMIYNRRDVVAMQELFYRQRERIPKVEQEIGLLTHNMRQHHFEVNQERLDKLVTQLNAAAEQAVEKSMEYVEDPDDLGQIFNAETPDGALQSIRYTRLKKIIQTKMGGEEMQSTSLKKLSPVVLARHTSIHNLLLQTTRAGKMVSHRRKASTFQGVDVVDAELGFWRSQTGRFSSPSSGRGLNLHNVPKHDKAVAKPIRQLFRVPNELCLVRADLANVEYRVQGKLCQCQTIIKMFSSDLGGNQLSDPYKESWLAMTRMAIDKNTATGKALRQLAKAAVLGLGFSMSAAGFANVLLKAIASGDTDETKLKDLILALNWYTPRYGIEDILVKTGCSQIVALSAYHIHRLFNEAHPEFKMTADWLVKCVNGVAQSMTLDYANRMLDKFRETPDAPDPNMLYLVAEQTDGFKHPSIRVQCGPWPRSLCWREPLMRKVGFSATDGGELKLTIRKASGEFKSFTKQLAIENVTQAAARNQLCWGLKRLESYGYRDILHVHDEVMLLVPRDRLTVLKARDALLNTFGPDAVGKPLGWATLVKPEEITVTQSLYEDEDDIAEWVEDKKTKIKSPGGRRWQKILDNAPGCLDMLP